MKKSILKVNIILLTFILMIGIMSVKVSAQITTVLDFTDESFLETSGEGWTWNKQEKTLTLDGADISVTTSKAIHLPDGAVINVTGNSSISTTANSAIYSEGLLTIKGEGLLTVNSTTGSVIETKGNLNIENAKVKSTTGGIFSYNNITVTNSNIDILSDRSGISTGGANANIEFKNSTLKVISSNYETNPNTQYYGIFTGGNNTTNGNISFINTNATIKYYFGISARSTNGTNGVSKILIDGGKLDITGGGPSSDYADLTITNKAELAISTRNQDWALHAYNGKIIVNKGSNIKVTGTGNGIFNNGTSNMGIDITDSTVKVLLPNSAVNGIICSDLNLKNSDVRVISKATNGMGAVYADTKISIDGGTFVVKDTAGTGYDMYTPSRYATNSAKIYYAAASIWFQSDSTLGFYKSTIDSTTGDVSNFERAYAYGDVHISEDFTVASNQQLLVNANSKLTVDSGAKITNNGIFATLRNNTNGTISEIINNGEIVNNNSMTVSALSVAPYTTCNLTNNGTIYNNSTFTNKGNITNNGKIINLNTNVITQDGTSANYTGNEVYTAIDHDLDFSQDSVKNLYNNPDGVIYWNNNKLKLKNLILTGNIILPDGVDVTIENGKNVEINGNISVKNGNVGTVIFTGETLNLNGSINGENGNIVIDGTRVNAEYVSATNTTSTLTLKNGAYLYATNGAYVGASGSTSGEIILEGASTLESVGDYATVGSGKFTIKDLESKMIIAVSEGMLAVSSGKESAFAGIKIPTGSHVGAIYSDTYTILDENDNPLNKLTITKITYSINASANEGGSITDIGTIILLPDQSKEYTIVPNEGYIIKNVIIDGVSKGSISKYNFENINSNHTIAVEFEKITLTVTINVGKGGTISHQSPIKVIYGEGTSIEISVLKGYKLNSVTINGKQYNVENNKVELTNIKENMKIIINFEAITQNDNNGSQSGNNNQGENNGSQSGNNNQNDNNENQNQNNGQNSNNENNNMDTVKTGDMLLPICITVISIIIVINILLIIKRKIK